MTSLGLAEKATSAIKIGTDKAKTANDKTAENETIVTLELPEAN